MQSLTQSPRGVECNRPIPPRIVHDQEGIDATAADLRRIADRCERLGWCRGREDAVSVLREIANAVEMEGVS
jgi:hypothetical protein